MSRRPDSRRGYDRERSPSRDSRGRQDSRRDYPSSGRDSYAGDRHDGRYGSEDRTRGGYQSSRGSQSRSYPSRSDSSSGNLDSEPSQVSTIPENGKSIQQCGSYKPQGTQGSSLKVFVNHFAIQSLPGIPVYQYALHFTLPPAFQRRDSDKVSSYNQARALIKGSSLFGESFVFLEGANRGWSIDKLLDIGTTRTALIDIDKDFQIEATIRAEKQLKFGGLVAHLQTGAAGTSLKSPDITDCLSFLGAPLRHDPASRFITRPNSNAFYDRTGSLYTPLASTGNVLEAIRGIFQSVSIGFGRLCVNVDTATTTFYTPNMPMVDVAKAFAGMRSDQDPSHPSVIRQFVHEGCQRLVSMFFCVRHLGSVKNAKHLRVTKISDVDATQLTFQLSEGGETTNVRDYFAQKYSINLKWPGLPLLSTKAGAFPLEVCHTAPGERYHEALQGRETADFIKFSTSPAYVRSTQVYESMRKLNWTNKMVRTFGISVNEQMVNLGARQLAAPIPRYGSGTDSVPPSGGAWNLRNKRFLHPSSFSAYGLCYFPGRHMISDGELQSFCRELVSGCSILGMGIPSGPPAFVKGNPSAQIDEVVKTLYQKTGNHFNRKPQMLVFILHDHEGPDLYKAIKRACEVDLGVASQVIIAEKGVKNVRGQKQYVANVAMKINAKLGGINVACPDPLFERMNVMNVGSDVSHPSPSERRKLPPVPSYAAMTASLDKMGTYFTAVAAAQPGGTETIQAQAVMFKALLGRYLSKNGKPPAIVLLYRDGLSSSEVEAFKETELAALLEVRKELNASFRLAVILCTKRHKTRLFPSGGRGDKLGNCFPGTCIEVDTREGEFDSFLITASALQGTIAPCRYTKLYDEVGLSTDDILRLANNSCFHYARATRSVGLVPPVYYAHQVAERAKIRLSRDAEGRVVLPDVHVDLRQTMYWQ